MSDEKTIRTFDEWATNGKDSGMEDSHGDVVQQVIDQMTITPGEKILDLGCGNGWATRILAQANIGVQAIGVDASPKMIARADELHSLTIRARYDLGGFEKLDFDDEDFTRLFSMEAIYYATDLDAALAEVFRVLKPGASADVLLDHYREHEASGTWPEECNVTTHWLAEAEWTAAFERAGFAAVAATRVHDRRGSENEAGTLWIHAEKPA